MKLVCLARTGMLSCALAATAAPAQVHQVAFEWAASDPRGITAVDTCVAASTSRVLVATNQNLMLLDRQGLVKDEENLFDAMGAPSATFPFQLAGTNPAGNLFDPRVEYDPVNDRLWILYPQRPQDESYLHIAVSKEGVTPQDFSSTYWHFYTGANAAPTTAR